MVYKLNYVEGWYYVKTLILKETAMAFPKKKCIPFGQAQFGPVENGSRDMCKPQKPVVTHVIAVLAIIYTTISLTYLCL